VLGLPELLQLLQDQFLLLRGLLEFGFDDPLQRDFARNDPRGFLAQFGDHPTILDEIQYVPELLSYLKMDIDANRQLAGRWVLSGSQQFELMRDVTESLAGRVAILERNDLLAIHSAGAYGFVMSSNYNGRCRAAEVLVKGDRFEIVRTRDRFEDLIRGESIPEDLTRGDSTSEDLTLGESTSEDLIR